MNNILPAIRKTPYLFTLYVVAVIVLPKLFGSIPGVVGALILIFGVYGITKKVELSKSRKIVYSIAVAIISAVISLLLSLLLMSFLGKYLDLNTDNALKNNQIESIATKNASDSKDLPQFKIYKFKNTEFSIPYPASWTVTESEDGYAASFDSPDGKVDIGATLSVISSGESMTLEKFRDGVIELSKNNSNDVPDQSSMVIKKINGKDWLFVNAVHKRDGYISYGRGAIYITGNYNGSQYVQMGLETYQEDFAKSAVLFDQIIELSKF
ncbi:MAG: hypothetical protein WCO09_00495 [bacterium]